MLYKVTALAFVAQAAAFSPALPSKMTNSRVARTAGVDMVKKSVRRRRR